MPPIVSLPSVAILTRNFVNHAIIGVKRFSDKRANFPRVIPEIDIWRAATLMLKRYGEKALDESMARADELAAGDEHNGAATWRRITDAVSQLANLMPPGALH